MIPHDSTLLQAFKIIWNPLFIIFVVLSSVLLFLVLIVQNLQNLQKATQDLKVAKKMFQDIDSDESGSIDIKELSELMNTLSMPLGRVQLEEVCIWW